MRLSNCKRQSNIDMIRKKKNSYELTNDNVAYISNNFSPVACLVAFNYLSWLAWKKVENIFSWTLFYKYLLHHASTLNPPPFPWFLKRKTRTNKYFHERLLIGILIWTVLLSYMYWNIFIKEILSCILIKRFSGKVFQLIAADVKFGFYVSKIVATVVMAFLLQKKKKISKSLLGWCLP